MQSGMRSWRVMDDKSGINKSNAKAQIPGETRDGIVSAFAGWQVNWDAVQALKTVKLGELGRLVSGKGFKSAVWMREEPMLWIYERRKI